MLPVSLIIDLFHHRWAAPSIAELHRTSGGKFVTLAKRLQVGRDSLRKTLQYLIQKGWVARNPGHGHPLRPEYILTAKGAELGPYCAKIQRAINKLDGNGILLRKWSVPVSLALLQGRQRFSELRNFLPDVTPKALVQTLKDLQRAQLVERKIVASYPPTSTYSFTPLARPLAAVLNPCRAGALNLNGEFCSASHAPRKIIACASTDEYIYRRRKR